MEVCRTVDVPCPVEVCVEKCVQVPYPVQKRVRQCVQVPYPVQKFVDVPQPYPVERIVQVSQPYPVEKIVCRQVPYTVQKIVCRQVDVPVEVKVRQCVQVPYPVQKFVDVPQPYHVDKVNPSAFPAAPNVLGFIPLRSSFSLFFFPLFRQPSSSTPRPHQNRLWRSPCPTTSSEWWIARWMCASRCPARSKLW